MKGQPPAPSVGIVAVNYNSAAFIGEFAESLRRVRYPNFRLIVVDSASTDGSADELARLVPDAVLLRSDENLGTAAGNNRGIAYCLEHGFDYVLLLNNDTVLTEDFLDRLVAAAGERTLAVPKILYYYDRRLISTHAGGFDWRRGVFRHTFHGRPDSAGRQHAPRAGDGQLLLRPRARRRLPRGGPPGRALLHVL